MIAFALLELIGFFMQRSPEPVLDQQRKMEMYTSVLSSQKIRLILLSIRECEKLVDMRENKI